MEQTLGYGVTPSSGGVTTLSTSQGGMSGYVPPLPGIFVWNMPPLEDAIPPGPVPIPPYRPPAEWLRSTMSMRGIVPQTPQMPTPVSCLYSPRVDRQPHISSWCSRQVKLQDWESPLTPQPPNLPPLTVRTLMYAGDRLHKVEMMAVGLPATPEEDKRGPLSGRLICQCLTRRVDAQLGCLVIPLHPPPQALRGLPLTLWGASLTIGAKGGRRT